MFERDSSHSNLWSNQQNQGSMNGESRPLVTDDPVEFEKKRKKINTKSKLKTSGNLPISFLRNLENIPQFHKQNPKHFNIVTSWTCKHTIGSQPMIIPMNLPDTDLGVLYIWCIWKFTHQFFEESREYTSLSQTKV